MFDLILSAGAGSGVTTRERMTMAASSRDDGVPDAEAGDQRLPVNLTLQEKIEYAFRTVRPPGEDREFTHQEISDRAKAAGYSISPSYVNALRRHPHKKPTVDKLRALAAGFPIPAEFFTRDANDKRAAELEENLALIAALERPEVRAFIDAVSGLPAETLEAVAEVINKVSEAEVRALTTLTKLSPRSREPILQMAEQALELERASRTD